LGHSSKLWIKADATNKCGHAKMQTERIQLNEILHKKKHIARKRKKNTRDKRNAFSNKNES